MAFLLAIRDYNSADRLVTPDGSRSFKGCSDGRYYEVDENRRMFGNPWFIVSVAVLGQSPAHRIICDNVKIILS